MKFGRKKPAQAARRRMSTREREQPSAFSYYAQRSDMRQNTGREVGREEQTSQQKNLFKSIVERGGLLLLVLAIVAGTINSLSLSTSPRIVLLTSTEGSFLHSSSDYENAASTILSSSIWNHNKVTVNTAAVSNQLKAQFPELAEASITLPLVAHRPIIYLEPSQAALILTESQGGFVVGQNGIALLSTTQVPVGSQLNLPVVVDQTGLEVRTGQKALSSSDVSFIETVTGELKARQIEYADLLLPAGASELDVHLKDKPYYVKFNMHASLDDARQQAGTFIAVKNKLESQHIIPGQYIDVRVGGRAYYR